MSKNSKIIIKNRRCVYPTLAAPKSFTGEEASAKYNIKLLIPKTDKEFVANFKEWVKNQIASTDWTEALKKQVFKNAFNSDDGQNDNCVLKDGDHVNTRREAEGKDMVEAYAGHYIISANRKGSFGPPLVVNADSSNMTPEMIEAEIVGGYWINTQVSAYCYPKPKPGVSIQLQAVQKVKNDEPFGRENPFDALEVEDVADVDSDENPFS